MCYRHSYSSYLTVPVITRCALMFTFFMTLVGVDGGLGGCGLLIG